MLREIKDLSWNQTLGAIFAFLGLVAPGLLMLFLFKPQLIFELETIKVLIFSLSLSMPIFVVNMFFAFQFEKDNEDPFEISTTSLFMSSIAAYVSILISYLINLNFKEFLIVLIAIEAIMIIAAVLAPRLKTKSKVEQRK